MKYRDLDIINNCSEKYISGIQIHVVHLLRMQKFIQKTTLPPEGNVNLISTVAHRGHAAILKVAAFLNNVCCNFKSWCIFK